MSFEICLSEINVPRLLIRSINFLRSEAKILPSIIVLNQWATFPSECHSCHFLLTAQNFSWDVICQESKNKKKILHLSISNDTVLVVFDVFNSDIKVFDRFLFVLKGYFWIYGYCIAYTTGFTCFFFAEKLRIKVIFVQNFLVLIFI